MRSSCSKEIAKRDPASEMIGKTPVRIIFGLALTKQLIH
jgi:hypothetical protein